MTAVSPLTLHPRTTSLGLNITDTLSTRNALRLKTLCGVFIGDRLLYKNVYRLPLPPALNKFIRSLKPLCNKVTQNKLDWDGRVSNILRGSSPNTFLMAGWRTWSFGPSEYDLQGTCIQTLRGPFGGHSHSCVTTPSGGTFVTENFYGSLYFRSSPGDLWQQVMSGHLGKPAGLSLTPQGNVSLIDLGTKQVLTFSSAGEHLSTLDLHQARVKAGDPRHLSCSQTGDLAISDWKNHCVYILQADGHLRSTIGTPGKCGRGAQQLDNPGSLSWDPYNRLLVCDQNNHRIQVFTSIGDYICTLIERVKLVYGPQYGSFHLTDDQHLLIEDTFWEGHKSVHVFKYNALEVIRYRPTKHTFCWKLEEERAKLFK